MLPRILNPTYTGRGKNELVTSKHYIWSNDSTINHLLAGGKMSKKSGDNIINLPIDNKVTDEEFQIFMDALLGPYKGGGYNPE